MERITRALSVLLCLFLILPALAAPKKASPPAPSKDCNTSLTGKKADKDDEATVAVANTVVDADNAAFDADAARAKNFSLNLSMANLRQHVERLSGVTQFAYRPVPDRFTGENKEQIRMFLIEFLNSLDIPVTYEHDRQSGAINIIGEIRGSAEPNTVLEVTAHYDTTKEDMPGADDNASGVAFTMEIARLLREHPPAKTVRVVFMDLEEHGFDGSRMHAANTREEIRKKKINFMGSVVVDTIAWADNKKPYLMVLEVGEAGDFGDGSKCKSQGFSKTRQCARQVAHQYLRYAADGKVREKLKLRVDTFEAKGGTADHGSYWNEDLPAMLFAAAFENGYVNPNYHKKTDTIEEYNWAYYELTSRFIAETVGLLAGVRIDTVTDSQNGGILATRDYMQNLVGPRPPPKPKPSGSSFGSSNGPGIDDKRILEIIAEGKPSDFAVVINPGIGSIRVITKTSAYVTYDKTRVRAAKAMLNVLNLEYFEVEKDKSFYDPTDIESLRKHVWGTGTRPPLLKAKKKLALSEKDIEEIEEDEDALKLLKAYGW